MVYRLFLHKHLPNLSYADSIYTNTSKCCEHIRRIECMCAVCVLCMCCVCIKRNHD